jgi:hypothetical protein
MCPTEEFDNSILIAKGSQKAHILETLFGQVFVPEKVVKELQRHKNPQNVKDWLKSRARSHSKVAASKLGWKLSKRLKPPQLIGTDIVIHLSGAGGAGINRVGSSESPGR